MAIIVAAVFVLAIILALVDVASTRPLVAILVVVMVMLLLLVIVVVTVVFLAVTIDV